MMFSECNVIVRLDEGLHARPSARVAKVAKGFRAAVEIHKGDRMASATSTVQLMLLAVKQGEAIVIRASGEDAEAAVEGLAALVSGAQGDPSAHAPAAPAAPEPAAAPPADAAAAEAPSGKGFRGIAASPGIAVGPAFVFLPEQVPAPHRSIAADDIPAERNRYHAAVASVMAGMQAAVARHDTDSTGDRTARDILQALLDLACDTELSRAVEAAIRAGQDAATAVLTVGGQLAARFAAMDDPYLRARSEDVRGIARQIADVLLGVVQPDLFQIAEPCVLIAGDLTAADFARLPAKLLLGLVTTEGTAASHVAIIARSLGIPAVVAVREEPAVLRRAVRAAVDGTAGTVLLNGSEEDEAPYRARLDQAAEAARALRHYIAVEPRTRGGTLIEVAANIGAAEEVAAATANGAMGVGLFRTEFLFMRGHAVPDEDSQAALYAEVLRACAPHAVVIRTADIGGDKPLPGLSIAQEANAFLGCRGIRLCLDRPDIFKPQLRALLRAAPAGRLRVMFPMVSDVSEVHASRALLRAAEAELRAEGHAVGPVELGIMIETPAAVLCADTLAREVDFFSIGTNDLTQYVMAADRTNNRLAHLQRADHPAVLRAIGMACAAAAAAGIWVGVCGEAAGDPALIPALVGMGVTELSMSPSLIPRAKKLITELD